MKYLLVLTLGLAACGQGPAGINGSSCTVLQVKANEAAPEGGFLMSCTDGSSALILNGSIIKPIQFCPGTPVYPAVFPEIGFIVDSRLYAVYSIPGSFLTEILPGDYTSDAVGSRCNFRVTANYDIVDL